MTSPSCEPSVIQNCNEDLIGSCCSRSRTNASTSTLVDPNPSPTSTRNRAKDRKSHDVRLSSGSNSLYPERSEGLAKTLMARGSRLLRRQNSKSDSTSLRTWQWVEASQEGVGACEEYSAKALGDLKHNRMHSTGNIPLRAQISQPYNFQHLTHTYANQLTRLDKASHSQLVSEFSAIRASQVPRRELKGIKAERLYGRTSSLQVEPLSPNWSLGSTSPPISPRSLQYSHCSSTQPRTGSLPYCRSIENFSQPSPKSYKSKPSAIKPPPRISSKKSVPEAFTFRESFNSQSRHSTCINDSSTLISPTTCTTLEWEDDLIDYSTTPHAVSTPDESALTLIPPLPSAARTELDDVPEEDEVSRWRRNTAPKSPPAAPGSGLRHSQSFPIVKASPLRWSNPSSEASIHSPISPTSDIPRWTESVIPLVDQPLDDIPLQPRLSRRLSTGLSGADCCWEDDIDYCYEHAAEADCEFDWDRLSQQDGEIDKISQKCDANPNSMNNEEKDGHTHSYSNDGELADKAKSSENLSSSFFTTQSEVSAPEFGVSPRDSTKSSTVSLAGPVTPSHSIISPPRLDVFLQHPKRPYFPDFGSSLFIPGEFETQMMPEDLYQRNFAGDHLEQHYSFSSDCLDLTSIIDNSPRSSHLPISKSNSQESFFVSQSAPSLCCHRDSNSISSLPELVYSKSAQSYRPALDEATDVTLSKSNTGLVTCHQTSQIVRPRRSQSLGKEIARQSVLQKLAIGSPTLYMEKPLPSAPDSQSLFQEKPLPLAPSSVGEIDRGGVAVPRV